MKILKNLTLIILAIVLTGCTQIDPDLKINASKDKNPWTHLKLYNDPDNFQFAIIADIHGANRSGVFEKAIEKINLLKPEFVMSVGDIIDGYTEDEKIIDQQWDELDALVNQLDMPFFYVPGNHDVTNEVMVKKWQQRLGPLYYHFVYRDVLFLCLDSEDPPRAHEADNIAAEQLEYFTKVLAQNKNVRWTIVFLHKPMWFNDQGGSWKKMEQLLGQRDYTVFAGHYHKYIKRIRNNHKYFVLSTTGGGGSGENGKLKGLEKCEFDHIVWVTMADDGPIVTNLLLEGILDDQPCPDQ